jgi:hypothetical protein
MVVAVAQATTGGPGWTDVLTAVGTVGAVVAAVGIALWTEWRSGKRIRAEHERADRLLREERERAAAELAEQREHERAALEEERRVALEREQDAEANSVQVALAADGPHEDQTYSVAVLVVNHGSYVITGVWAVIRLGGPNPSLVPSGRGERIPGTDDLPEKLLLGMSGGLEVLLDDERLAPWDVGLRFPGAPVSSALVPGAFAVVRWTDKWGVHWEYQRGAVRRVRADEPLLP